MSDKELKKQYEAEMALYDQYLKEVGSEEEVSAPQEVPPGDTADTLSDMAVSAPQGITSWADEAQALGSAALQIGGGSKRPFGELQEESLKGTRERLALARERSPIASRATEAAVGIGSAFIPGTGLVTGAGKFAGAVPMIARGAFEGLGTAEDKASIEGATYAGIGAGLGAGGALVAGGLKKLTSANPNAIRANVLGARTTQFKEIGIKEREEIAKELKGMGLFQSRKVKFDVNAGKFIPQGKTLENVEKPVREKLLERVQTATKAIQKEKMKLISRFANDPVDVNALENDLTDMAIKFSEKGTDKAARLAQAMEVKDAILADIADDVAKTPAGIVTLGMIEKAKMRLKTDVGNYGKNPLLAKTPETAQIFQNMYRAINENLKKGFGNTKYSHFNELQQKLLTAESDLTSALASESATTAQAGWGGWMNKIANETLGSPEAGLGIAKAADIANLPGLKQAQIPFRIGMEEAPFAGIRYIDPSTMTRPQNNSRGPNGLSVTNLSPREVSLAKLPRTTDGIIENGQILLAKMAQEGATDIEMRQVATALKSDKRALKGFISKLMAGKPGLFEEDEYGALDGIILDPNNAARAADDISIRDDLNSIQKARMKDSLNKNKKLLGE